jgi:hypothetical protein
MGQCSVLDISEANLRCERCNSQIYNNLAVVNLTCAKASYIEIQDQIKSKALTSRHRVAASWFGPFGIWSRAQEILCWVRRFSTCCIFEAFDAVLMRIILLWSCAIRAQQQVENGSSTPHWLQGSYSKITCLLSSHY